MPRRCYQVQIIRGVQNSLALNVEDPLFLSAGQPRRLQPQAAHHDLLFSQKPAHYFFPSNPSLKQSYELKMLDCLPQSDQHCR